MTDGLGALEEEVQRVARELAAHERSHRPGLFRLGGWSERMLAWAMSHPDFKTQLFRFVDVFPATLDDDDVLRHLSEYLDGVVVPRALDLGIDVAEHVPLGAHVTAAVARRNVARMGRQFIAGTTPRAAVRRLEQLWRGGEASTVDLLGEKVVTDAEADTYARRIAALLDELVRSTREWPERPRLEHDPWGPLDRVAISVKATALSPLFGPLTAEEGIEQARRRLEPLLVTARESGAAVTLDAEHDEVKDLAHELLRRIGADFPDGPQLGCVVQAYRLDAEHDVRALVDWSRQALGRPLQIRLVKGAYWDSETIVARAAGWPSPVFTDKVATDASYERCTRVLLDHAGTVRPAFGTHNLRSAAHAIAYARSLGLDDRAVEVQMLYGMAEPVHAALVDAGFRVRVYAPVGELVPGMAYLVRRLLENTSNESFVRHHYTEGESLDELLAAPAPRAAPATAPRRASDAAFVNEPHAELRRPGPRARIADALAVFAPGFAAPVVVDGSARSTDGEIVSVDPGKRSVVVCRSGSAGPADVEEAFAVATTAWPAWRDTPWAERAAVLRRAGALMRARRDELVALEVFEAGKPIPEADADVCEAVDFCEYYAHEALRLGTGATLLQVPGEANRYGYQPRGVGVVIAPWNFPLAIPTGMVTAALVTGNAVLFKPAEQTPGVAARLVEILLAAGVPPGVLAFLPGVGEDIGPLLVEDPRTAFVAFTGSKAVGLHILETAAVHRPGQRHVKRVIAEMGGKNPVVVDADADLDVAVPEIVKSAFGYAGQKCSAASRVIALGSVFDALVERLVGAAAIVPVGHPREMRTVVGPLIDEDAWRRVHEYRRLAATEGDVLLARDDVPDDGNYVGPCVVVVDDPRARVFTDEIFGPVLTCIRAEDFDHALALANDTDYALTAGIFSRSPVRIAAATETLRAGNVYVNRGITGALVGRQPFGGYGLSGVGSKAGGPDYLLQFVEPRVVTENTVRQGFV